MDAYLVAILTTAGLYAILALGLNLQYGTTGIINFGVAGFYGIGAYTSGLVTLHFGVPFAFGLASAILAGGLAGALLAPLSLRLGGDFLGIVTLGFAETIHLVLTNEDWLTRGPRGLLIQDSPVPAGLSRGAAAWFYLAIVLLLLVLVFLVVNRLARSPYGRVLRAIREDDIVPGTLGKAVFIYRLQTFIIGSMAMAAAGSLYAHYVLTITPDDFTMPIAVLVWMSVIVGGAGNNVGTILGALAVTVIYEGTRFIAPLASWFTPEQISALRHIIIGVLLILTIRFRPEGLLPERAASFPQRFLAPAPSRPSRQKG